MSVLNIKDQTGNWVQIPTIKGEKGDKGDTGEISLENLYPHFITNTASGTVASFEDGADNVPMKDIKVQIEPVQDLNGQESPYPAGGGKNLFDDTVYVDYKQSDGSFIGTGAEIKRLRMNIPETLVGAELTFSADIQIPSGSTITRPRVAAIINNDSILGNYISVSGTYQKSTVTFTPLSTSDCILLSYTDGTDQNVQFKNVQLEIGSTATDYVPYSNICPIIGWTGVNVSRTGVNIWDEEWEVGNISSADGTNSYVDNRIRSKNYIPITPNTGYYFKSANTIGIRWYDVDKTYIGYTTVANGTKTSPENAYYMRFICVSTTTYNHDISINYPSTDNDYHVYTGNSYNISWETEAGTIYGGTLDVTTGELVVDRAMIEVTECVKVATASTGIQTASIALNPLAIQETTQALSNMYKLQRLSAPSTSGWFRIASYLYIYDNRFTDKTVADNILSVERPQFCYPLATPVTYNLTPTEITSLLGINNIWADTGDITTVYRADAKLYIDSVDFPVDDVQVNGTSIVENGIANVPIADNSTLGVMKPSSGLYVGSTGALYTNKATSASIKTGTNNYLPIVPSNQHEASFYGLAKAAGDTTQSASDNEVGQYTDNAKTAINRMLGIKYDPDSLAVMGAATGNVVSFEDGADNVPFKDVKVNINPVQDLHGYDSPWPAGGGKNLWDVKPYVGLPYNSSIGTTVSLSSSSSVSENVTVNNNVLTYNATSAWGSRNFKTAPLKAGTYYIHFNVESDTSGSFRGTRYVVGNDGTNDVVKQATIYSSSNGEKGYTVTVEENDYIVMQIGSTVAAAIALTDFQIESGTAYTSWSPYENICPINGWTGANVWRTRKNLCKATQDNALSYTNYGEYTLNNGVVTTGKTLMGFIVPVKPSTSYTFSLKKTTESWVQLRARLYSGYPSDWTDKFIVQPINYYVADANSTGSITVETTVDTQYVIFAIYATGTSITVSDFQVELGTVATDYEPYEGVVYPITFPTEADTIYGGTLDVTTGELTVDRVSVDLGTLDWTYLPSEQAFPYFATTSLNNRRKTGSTLLLSSIYKAAPGGRNTITENCMISTYNITNSKTIVARNDAYTDPDVFKTAMSGVQLVYELETPQTYQLTPTEITSLLGRNYIFADTGDITVEYRADTKVYIDATDFPVDDVQINGSSIINDGVADIPIASASTLGVVKVTSSNGVAISGTNNLIINRATETTIKAGVNNYLPIVSKYQHESVFYGLAKAAGDTTQSASSNETGIYTDEAKAAIKQMLDIKDDYDSLVVEVSGTDPVITGKSSYRYNCGELYTLSVTPPAKGTIDIIFTSGTTPTVLTFPNTVKMPDWWAGVETNTTYEMCITDGVYCGVMSWAT